MSAETSNIESNTTVNEPPDMEITQARQALLMELRQEALNHDQLERETIEQHNCNRWHELRNKRLTASFFSKVCKRRAISPEPLVRAILSPDPRMKYISVIQYGINNESQALAQLKTQENIEITNCGLFIDPEYCFLGASPDGVFKKVNSDGNIIEEGIVEIKCPSSVTTDLKTAIKDKKISYLELNESGEVLMKQNADCHYQIQGQLHITNKNVCLFAVWLGPDLPLEVVRVYKDDNFWQEMLPKLERFYMEVLLPEIIQRRL